MKAKGKRGGQKNKGKGKRASKGAKNEIADAGSSSMEDSKREWESELSKGGKDNGSGDNGSSGGNAGSGSESPDNAMKLTTGPPPLAVFILRSEQLYRPLFDYLLGCISWPGSLVCCLIVACPSLHVLADTTGMLRAVKLCAVFLPLTKGELSLRSDLLFTALRLLAQITRRCIRSTAKSWLPASEPWLSVDQRCIERHRSGVNSLNPFMQFLETVHLDTIGLIVSLRLHTCCN